jgi:NAD(P)H-hydrate epimerase
LKPLPGFEDAALLERQVKGRYGLSDDVLMEAAAIGMVRAIENDESLARSMDGSRIPALAICGRGNNGGDALAVLRRLSFAGRMGLVAIVQDNPGAVCSRRLEEARASGVTIIGENEKGLAKDAVAAAGIILDGITGTGFKGPRRTGGSALHDLFAGAHGPVVAIDVPSGVGPLASFDSDPPSPVSAFCTLSVEPLKAETFYQGYRRFAGRVVPVGGVFPVSSGTGAPAMLLEEGDLPHHLPGLEPDMHKGQRGALGIMAGSIGSTGAAVLCARAGTAAGAGSVTLMVKDSLVPVLSGLLVSQMVRPVSSPGSRRFNAVLAGPGWGLDESNATLLGGLFASEIPLVLDADALRLMVLNAPAPRVANLVLTPHPGEFLPLAVLAMGREVADPSAVELAGRRAKWDSAAMVTETARRFGAVVVLKGSVTWIGDPQGHLAVWDGRNPLLAAAGSGDVLAGLIGGYLARGASAWDAAIAAVMAHGIAGNRASLQGFFEIESLLEHLARLSCRKEA